MASGPERFSFLLVGEEHLRAQSFDALEERGAFLWGQARRDGYVGYVDRDAFWPTGGALPTHWVKAIRVFAFTEPSIKARAVGPFTLNALVHVLAEEGAFSASNDGLWFWTAHLAPIGAFEPDPAAVAERFVGAPYLWGGRTSVGLDCSALVQQALYACGRACPRDTDQQALLGRPVDRGEPARGDLVCWPGHIGMMLDEARLIHANAFHMCVAVEPADAAIARIGPPTALRRA